MTLITGVFLLLAITLFCYRRFWAHLHEWYRKRKLSATILGPNTAPLIGNTLQIGRNPFDFVEYALKAANDVVENDEHLLRLWIGSSLIVFPLDGEALKPIVESNVEIMKGTDYDFFRPWLGDGLLTSTGEKWKTRRKMLTPVFHFKMLLDFITVFEHESKILVEQLDKYADNETELDAQPFMKRCTLDIICSTAMGVKLGAQIQHDSPYFKAVEQMSLLGFEYSLNPLYWIEPVWYALGKAQQAKDAVIALRDFSQKVIKERRSKYISNREVDGQPKSRMAFLDMLLAMQHENKLTDEDIREEVDTFMFAGHDTTSTAISWTLWCLATHPHIQAKVIEEIDSVFEHSDMPITMESLQSLKYLERCIKESLRLFPSVPFVQRNLQHDLAICGKILPKGTNCIISPFLVHRNKKAFPNVNSFDPDNFLQERIAERHPYSYVPFSAGPRNCIGQKFALLETKTVLATILRKFTLRSTRKFHSNRCGSQVTMKPENGVPIILKRRQVSLERNS